MNSIDAGRCIARLMAAFPNPTWTHERQLLFSDELGQWDTRAGERAVVSLVRSMDRCPSVAQLIEACRLNTQPESALPRGECTLCEDGWVMVDPEGRTTVAKCPSGCKPNIAATDRPVSRERAQQWVRHIKRMVSEKRFAEMRAGSQPEGPDLEGNPNDPMSLGGVF